MEITKVTKRNDLEMITVCEIEYCGLAWECEIEYDAGDNQRVTTAMSIDHDYDFTDEMEDLLIPLVVESNEMELRGYKG